MQPRSSKNQDIKISSRYAEVIEQMIKDGSVDVPVDRGNVCLSRLGNETGAFGLEERLVLKSKKKLKIVYSGANYLLVRVEESNTHL